MFSPTKHCAIFGLSGFGKDVAGERYIAEKSGKFKVIDLFSEERGEGMLYSMPSSNYNMNKRLEWLSNKRLKPKGYDNEILMFLGTNLEYFPKLPKNIKIITFSEDDVTNDDLVDFLAFNESQRGLMDMILYNNSNKRMTFSSVERYLTLAKIKETPENEEMKGSHRMTIFTILRRIASIKSSGLFHNKDSKYFHKFNFEDCVKDIKTISSFSTLLLPKEEQRGLALGILMKKVLEMRKKSKSRVPVLFYVRELSFFYRKNVPTFYNLLKDSFNKILREGRDLKYTLVINSQLPQDLPDYIFKQFNKVICLKIPDPRILLRKAAIDPFTIKKLENLDEKGVGIYISSGKYRYPIYLPPTMHQKKQEGFDVFTYLGTKFGKIDYSCTEFLKLDLQNPRLEEDKKKYEEEVPVLLGK